MTAPDIATKCIDDVEARLKTLTSMQNKVFHVYSEDELLDETKGLVFPCLGVVYDGMRAGPETGSTSKQGISGVLTVTILMFFRSDVHATQDPKDTAAALLDQCRALFRANPRSPSGHYWQFNLESPVGGKKGVLTYVQRWSTPVQLV